MVILSTFYFLTILLSVILILLILSLTAYFLKDRFIFYISLFLSILLLIKLSVLLYDKVYINFSITLVGVSYFMFKLIHYLFEKYKKNLETHSLLEFLSYMFFIPVLVVGPINRFPEYLVDLRNSKVSIDSFDNNFKRILIGYFKIIFIAVMFRFSIEAAIPYISEPHSFFRDYLGEIKYWINLYLLFSGYSDIAIGFSGLLGFKIIENFNKPYLAKNISDFWSRWHISLTSMIKEYFYFFIAYEYRKPFLGILISMIIFGLWHEFSLKYILWALYQTVGILIWYFFQKIKRKNKDLLKISKTKTFKYASMILTFNYIICTFFVVNFILEKI